MAKFTDQQLSMIMSAHAAGDMVRGGAQEINDKVCVLQAAYGVDLSDPFSHGVAKKKESQQDLNIVEWFDATYDWGWSIEEFLAELEGRKLA